jgi:hypothetical protein
VAGESAKVVEGPFDTGSLPPEVGGDSGPPGEITFELFYGDQLVQKKVGQNNLSDIISPS